MKARFFVTVLTVGLAAGCTAQGPLVSQASPSAAAPSPSSVASASPAGTGAGSWRLAATMSTPRSDFAAVAMPAGKVLLIGGQTSATADTASVEIYDPATSSLSIAAPMSTPRSGFTATVLRDGKVLVAGGSAAPGGGALTSAETYDPATRAWTRAAGMHRARTHHAAALMLNGKVLVAGGAQESYPAMWEVYDEATNTWTSIEAFDPRPDGPTATLLRDGRVLVEGGQEGTPPTPSLFDPATSTFIGTPVPMLDTSRIYATSALVIDGTVITAGGQASALGGGALNTTEIYSPAKTDASPNGLWQRGPAMNTGHAHHTLTTLADGRVLVAGGSTEAGSSAATGSRTEPVASALAELYDPSAKAWSAAASMQIARGHHVAVRLNDGRVLVAGGIVSGGDVTSSIEVYIPA